MKRDALDERRDDRGKKDPLMGKSDSTEKEMEKDLEVRDGVNEMIRTGQANH